MTKIVRVNFLSVNSNGQYKDYAYRTDDETIEVGDHVVVDAPSSGYTIVKVISLKETVDSIEKVSKWIIQKIDDSAYKARVEKEERRRVLLAKIEQAKKEALETMALAEAAKMSPELAAAVAELQAL